MNHIITWSSFCATFSLKSLCNFAHSSCFFTSSFSPFESLSSSSVTLLLSSATRRCHELNSADWGSKTSVIILFKAKAKTKTKIGNYGCAWWVLEMIVCYFCWIFSIRKSFQGRIIQTNFKDKIWVISRPHTI